MSAPGRSQALIPEHEVRRVQVRAPGLCRSWGLRAVPLLAALLSLMAGPALAGRAHVHGHARADFAVDGPVLSVELELPLDSLVGFEHAPRTPAQRRAVDQALARLRDAASWLRPDVAADCRSGPVDLVGPAWLLAPGATPPPAPAASGESHADVEVRVEWRCGEMSRLTGVELALFEAFGRLQRIDVQVAAARGQSAQTLRRPERRVRLGR